MVLHFFNRWKHEKPEKVFPLGCTKYLGHVFTLFKKSLENVKNLKHPHFRCQENIFPNLTGGPQRARKRIFTPRGVLLARRTGLLEPAGLNISFIGRISESLTELSNASSGKGPGRTGPAPAGAGQSRPKCEIFEKSTFPGSEKCFSKPLLAPKLNKTAPFCLPN